VSALRSAAVGVGALIAEELLVTSKGGAGAISGAAGIVARVIDRLGDPSLPLIADRTTPSSSKSSPAPKASSGTTPTGPTGQTGR